MPATSESSRRTHACARVIGPFITLVPGIVILRTPDLGTIIHDFFQNTALVWMMGALLLLCGLMIIAWHQYWSSPAAIAISLFGWFLALRGLALLAMPQVLQKGALGATSHPLLVRAGFGLLMLLGCWLTIVGWRTPQQPAVPTTPPIKEPIDE